MVEPFDELEGIEFVTSGYIGGEEIHRPIKKS